MKRFMTGLLRGRIRHWGLLGSLLIAVGAVAGWSDQQQFRLGGAWVGSGGGGSWNAVQTPLDPSGRTAAGRVNIITYSAEFAGFLATFGADSVSDFTGQVEMISGDTGKFTVVAYGTKHGNPPLICLLLVFKGTIQFTGPDSFVENWIMEVYPGPANTAGLPNADADGDGFPDPGVTPLYSIPAPSTAKRITLG